MALSIQAARAEICEEEVVTDGTTITTHDKTITITSFKPGYPDLSFSKIRLSCESDPYTSGKNYAGFILYGWKDKKGRMLTDWRLNGKHCKSGYLVIQSTDSPRVKKHQRAGAPGVVHGAVYWNVFGSGSKVKQAVGEGFSLLDGRYEWNSYTFNTGSNGYHDYMPDISSLAEKCVRNILDDWKETSEVGKTYTVQELLAED